MAVIRVNKTADYTVMSNSHFREKEMTLKAKGLLSMMLSLPEEWNYSIAGLVTLSKDGKDSVMSALSELEEFGYLKRTQVTDEKGKFAGYDYDVYEKPNTDNPQSENPNEENPNEEKPYAEKPNTDNPPQYNTYKLNTDKSNTDKSKKQEYIVSVVDYLNQKAGTNYRPTSKGTKSHINARLSEGYSVDDFKVVIDKKCAEWRGTDMEKYLRPSTLFGSKFDDYLNQRTNGKTYGANGIAINQNEPDDLAGIL